jgi:hypothetical protein
MNAIELESCNEWVNIQEEIRLRMNALERKLEQYQLTERWYKCYQDGLIVHEKKTNRFAT